MVLNTALVLILVLTAVLSVSMVFVGLPGTFTAIVGIILCAALDGFSRIQIIHIVIFILLAIAAEALEYLSGYIGARKFGASKKSIAGALIGGLLGAVVFGIIIPVVGSFIGIFAGSFLGTFVIEYLSGKTLNEANRAGIGTIIGRIGAIVVKIAILLSIFIIVFQIIF